MTVDFGGRLGDPFGDEVPLQSWREPASEDDAAEYAIEYAELVARGERRHSEAA